MKLCLTIADGPAWLVAVVCVLGLVGCSTENSADPTETVAVPEEMHPDGVTYHGVVHFAQTPLVFRLLDAAPTDRPYYAVNWRGGRITSVAHHRALGGVSETIHVEYPESGGVRYVWLNAYGVLDRSEEISADGTYSREMRSGILTHRGCSSLGRTFFKNGLPAMESCHDPDDRTVIDEVGCQSVHYQWTEDGDPQESACFDEYGTAVGDALGVHRTTFAVDSRGLETERAFFDADGQPAGRASDGCARWRTEVDSRGLKVAETCLDSGGLPTEVANSSHAGWTADHDANGCLIHRRYVSTTGSAAQKAKIAEDLFTNDPHCGFLEERHLDRAGKLRQPSEWTAARRLFQRNEEGQVDREECFGTGGRTRSCLHMHETGGSVRLFTYDEKGRIAESTAFKANGSKTRHDRWYPHVLRYEYNDEGLKLREHWEDESGRPARALDVWAFEQEYDALGAQVLFRVVDRDGNLTHASFRCASIATRYDESHRQKSRECLGKTGELRSATLIQDEVEWNEAARVEVVREENHQATANVFYSTSGRRLRTVKCDKLETPCYR